MQFGLNIMLSLHRACCGYYEVIECYGEEQSRIKKVLLLLLCFKHTFLQFLLCILFYELDFYDNRCLMHLHVQNKQSVKIKHEYHSTYMA